MVDKIEVLHVRHPDFACQVTVWINGVQVPERDVTVADVDPGAGAHGSMWKERIVAAEALDTPFGAATAEALREAGDSQYIDDDDDEDDEDEDDEDEDDEDEDDEDEEGTP